jgi:class 3 adenylate cyclase
MAADHERTITRGFLVADLRGYTYFVEQRGAAAAAELLTRYRTLARDAIGRFGGAEIKTEGDSFYVVFDSVSSTVRADLRSSPTPREPRTRRSASVSASMRARRSRPTAATWGRPSTSPRGSARRPARARSSSARQFGL